MKLNFSNLMSERDFKMTKILSTKFITTMLISAFVILFANSLAAAQEIPPAKIIVVDNRLISTNAAVAIDINRQVNQIRSQLQAEITVQETALAAEEESLKGQSAIMPQEAYNQKAEEFQQKVVEYRRDVQVKSRQLEIAITNANAEVERALKPILQSMLQTTGATMLLDRTIVTEQIPGLDVTTRIIEQLDIDLPSLEVVLPPVPEVAPVAPPAAN